MNPCICAVAEAVGLWVSGSLMEPGDNLWGSCDQLAVHKLSPAEYWLSIYPQPAPAIPERILGYAGAGMETLGNYIGIKKASSYPGL